MRTTKTGLLWLPLLAAAVLLACGTEPDTTVRSPLAPEVPAGWELSTNTPAAAAIYGSICGVTTNGTILAWEGQAEVTNYEVLSDATTNRSVATAAVGTYYIDTSGLCVFLDTASAGSGTLYYWVAGTGTSGNTGYAGPVAIDTTAPPAVTGSLSIDIDTQSFWQDSMPEDVLLFLAASTSGGENLVYGPLVASGIGNLNVTAVRTTSLASVYTVYWYDSGLWSAVSSVTSPGSYRDPEFTLP